MKKLILAIFCILLSTDFGFAADSSGCQAGYRPDTTLGCAPCEEGTWSSAGATSCSPCNMPTGAIGTSTGNTSATSCSWKLTCAAGTHWNGSYCATCVGTGYYSDSETTYTGTGNSLPAKQCKSACNSPAITNDAGTGCKCPNNNYTQNGNTCVPKIYTIELDKNCSWCTVQNGKFYEKYSVGFSNTENGNFVSPENFTVNLSNLNTNRWFGYELAGYYTSANGGSLIVNAEGKLNSFVNTTYFKENTNKTLYAHWDGKTYIITYSGDYAPTNTQNCKFGTNCTVQSPTQKPNGRLFNGWKCTSGCNSQIILNSGDNFKDNENKIQNLAITLTAQWGTCPRGYYCANGTQTPCPIGATTSGAGKTSIDECVMVRGNGGTKFCDKDNNCFYLPGSENIEY